MLDSLAGSSLVSGAFSASTTASFSGAPSSGGGTASGRVSDVAPPASGVGAAAGVSPGVWGGSASSCAVSGLLSASSLPSSALASRGGWDDSSLASVGGVGSGAAVSRGWEHTRVLILALKTCYKSHYKALHHLKLWTVPPSQASLPAARTSLSLALSVGVWTTRGIS